MTIIVTSRHFKAHQSLVTFAEEAVKKLTRIHDGILRAEVILKFEKTRKSVKIAEIIVSVSRTRLAATEESEDFHTSIDRACAKLRAQLRKYKERLKNKDRLVIRRVQGQV